MTRFHLVVVGGGITGLAAAWEAHRRGAEVLVLEGSDQLGGKLRTSAVAGAPVDESADAFLARVPDAMDLCTELGLGTELITPATGRAYVWVDGQLRPLPEAQLLGVPTDLDVVAASGILSPEGLARAREDLSLPASADDRTTVDEAVGALVRRRLGDEVLDRLVAPLVGGIWAGDCDRLSLLTATPVLADARLRASSLIRGAAEIRAAALAAPTTDPIGSGVAPSRAAERTNTGPGGLQPVFLAPRGGMARLVSALAEALGARTRTGQVVEHIERPAHRPHAGRWLIRVATQPGGDGWGERGDAEVVTADAVIVATPAFAAAPLVVPHCRPAGEALATIDYASMVLLTLAVPRAGIDRPLDGSGFLVPPSAGRLLTTCSWTSAKWPHLTGGDGSLVLLRASAGREGDDRALCMDDPKLVSSLLADLTDTIGPWADPVEGRINGWWRLFPQPRPGHLDRVAVMEAELAHRAPGLLVAGAWARGVGIPACIRSGRQAAANALANGRD